jgi:predicted ester cyclase
MTRSWGTLHGVDGFRQLLGLFDAAFPHHRVEVHQILGEGDYVSVLHTHLARHGGEFMGLPVTGKEVRVPGVEIFRMQNGKVAEFWRHDDAGLLMQLGIVSAPQSKI